MNDSFDIEHWEIDKAIAFYNPPDYGANNFIKHFKNRIDLYQKIITFIESNTILSDLKIVKKYKGRKIISDIFERFYGIENDFTYYKECEYYIYIDKNIYLKIHVHI